MMRGIAGSLIGLEHVVRKAVLRGKFEIRIKDAMHPVILGVRYIGVLRTELIIFIRTLRIATFLLLDHPNITSSVHFSLVVHCVPRDVRVQQVEAGIQVYWN